jgi:restriction endonuclease S subunit
MECFKVYSNEIEGRLDPYFYRPAFIQFYQQLEKAKFEIKTIGEITEKVTSGATPLSKGDAYTSKEEGIPFIRSGDINEDKQINFDEVLYIKEDIHNKLLKGSKLKKGDILIAIVGATIGQISIYDYNKEANINQAIALVRLTREINPEYVKAFMISPLGQRQLDRIKRPVARANINLDEIRSIKIILPTLAIQNKVVALMENAYKEQKNRESKINEFLDSIDDYVLDELGIKVPELKDKMCFIVDSEEIKGKRIDPKGYSEIPRGILKAIKKAKYSQKTLSNLIEKSISGEWGEDIEDIKDKENYVFVNVLRNTNFCNKSNLDFSEVAQRMIDKEKFEKVRLENGDILIEKSGGSPTQPVGRVAIIEDVKTDFAFSNFLQAIRIKKQECLPEYLFCFLKTLYSLNYMEYIQNQTTGIKNLIMEEFLSIPVSLPPMNKQKEIAREYKNRLEAAEQLKLEAKSILEEAKEKVERIILGNEEI